jgi:hypothetical protein
LLEAVSWHHAAGVEICLAAPVEMLPGEGEIKPSSRCLEHPNTFGHNFTPDAIAFDYRYPIRFQVSSLLSGSLLDRQPIKN